MLIRDSDWEKIRGYFTEAEKIELRKAVSGKVICPSGITIDRQQARPEILQKLDRLLLYERRPKGA